MYGYLKFESIQPFWPVRCGITRRIIPPADISRHTNAQVTHSIQENRTPFFRQQAGDKNHRTDRCSTSTDRAHWFLLEHRIGYSPCC